MTNRRGRWLRETGESASSTHPYDLHVGRYGPQLAQGLIRSAEITDTGRVVDVGCGTGQLAAKLAELVGAERVSGIDPNEAVVAVARDRVPGADIRVGSAEALPFADQSFDAALAQLVVNLVGDSPLAVREMARRFIAIQTRERADEEGSPLGSSSLDLKPG